MDKKWYLHRISTMPPREILLRAWRYAAEPLVRKRIKHTGIPKSIEKIIASSAKVPGRYAAADTYTKISDEYTAQLCAQADEICAHRVCLFGKQYDLGEKIDWYRDYSTNMQCPKVPLGKTNYRHPDEVGNIMYTWWLNRHQHLMPVACAYYATGKETYAEEICAQINSWCSESPYPYGPGWMTAIEAGVRLLTWAWLYRFLMARGRPAACTDEFMKRWFITIRQHMRFIDTRWARYSSANNHTFAEAAGIHAAASTWPGLCDEESMLSRAQDYLTKECVHQISHDGVHQELALSYHAFVLELLVSVSALDEHIEDICGREMQLMAEMLYAVIHKTEEPPCFGDSDDAVATGILPRNAAYYSCVSGAVHAREVASLSQEKTVTSPLFWYCGHNKPAHPEAADGDYADGGIVVWNTKLNTHDVKALYNVGGLGLPPLAAHGHADALSLTLHIDGEPVLIDPGTYAYHTEPEWRDYFRSTRAHNTLRINDAEQSSMNGPFLWAHTYRTSVRHAVATPDQLDVVARHNGYVSRFGVIHRRALSWHPGLQKLIIQDELIGNGDYSIELFFHVHPKRTVTQRTGNTVRIEGTGYYVDITFSDHLTLQVANGEDNPIIGWYSPRFGEKIPCPVICAKGPVIGCDNIFTECSLSSLYDG